MKNAILKTKYVLLVLSVVFASSCNPEDGEMGPEGPAGQDGQDGNANVTSVIFRDQSLSPRSVTTIVVSQLTQEIFDKGLVHVYIDDGGSNASWKDLPIIVSGEKLISLQEIEVGQIKITNFTNTPFVVHFKIVLIEGN